MAISETRLSRYIAHHFGDKSSRQSFALLRTTKFVITKNPQIIQRRTKLILTRADWPNLKKRCTNLNLYHHVVASNGRLFVRV